MDAASKIGVAKFATNFERIAGEHDKLSDNWLKTAAAFGVVTLTITGFLVYCGPIWPLETISADTSVFPYVLSKIVFVSFLYFVCLWAAKNYKAHRHLAVLNHHRQNSLSTFETFVEATKDKQTKEAVLLEATHCIFATGTTGYLGKEPEPPTSRVVEIIKSIGSASE